MLNSVNRGYDKDESNEVAWTLVILIVDSNLSDSVISKFDDNCFELSNDEETVVKVVVLRESRVEPKFESMEDGPGLGPYRDKLLLGESLIKLDVVVPVLDDTNNKSESVSVNDVSLIK